MLGIRKRGVIVSPIYPKLHNLTAQRLDFILEQLSELDDISYRAMMGEYIIYYRGKIEINEEEAVAIRTIFDQYVNTDMGSNGIAKYLENHGIHKIAYGRRRTEKVH